MSVTYNQVGIAYDEAGLTYEGEWPSFESYSTATANTSTPTFSVSVETAFAGAAAGATSVTYSINATVGATATAGATTPALTGVAGFTISAITAAANSATGHSLPLGYAVYGANAVATATRPTFTGSTGASTDAPLTIGTAPSPIQGWVNPEPHSLRGEDSAALSTILTSLESYLNGPLVAPQGILLGNGTAIGGAAAPPTTTFPFGFDLTPPAGVTGLTVTGGVRSLVVRYTAVADTDVYRYELQVATDSGFTSVVATRYAGGSSSVVAGLTYGTTYYVRARAIDQWGNIGTWSSTVTGTPAQVSHDDIVANTITADLIAAATITGDLIAANTIEGGSIKSNSIDTNHLKANSVTSTAIAANAVTATQIDAGAITTAKLAAGAVTADKITANTITATQISIGGITAATIADLAITEAKIDALAVTTGKIATNAITSDKVDTGAITAGKIAADSVTATEIAAGTITATEIAADTITAAQIAANTITAAELSTLTLAVGKWIHSSTYSSGTAGWAIDGDGNAEFNDITIRGSALIDGDIQGASVTAGRIQSPDFNPASPTSAGWGIDYLGGAYFNEGFFQGKVAAGSITSNVYTAGSAGWTIDADGNAEFNDVTVRGTVAASTVTGSQIYGSSFVLTSGYSGQRVEMLSSTPNQISFYTGDTSGDFGYLKVTSDYVELGSPVDSGSVSHIYMYSSGDDPTYSDTHIVMDANYVSAGTFVGDAYMTNGSYQGATSGSAGPIKMTSANVITFGWDGTDITFYVDGTGVKTL